MSSSIQLSGLISVNVVTPLATTGSNTPTLSISQSDSLVSGFLSSTDWNTFNNKVSSSLIGVSNGLATLDAGGKVPVSQLPNSIMDYLGTYNIVTNTPTLVDGTGNAGDVYRCSVAGTRNFGSGPITVGIGDWLIYSGSIWEKSANSDAVVSVNGYVGVVVLAKSDVGLGSVENTALSTWAGTTNITTLGTIGTGVWQGTSISTTYTDAKIKTVTGTTNRLTIGGTSTDPTFDISSSYVGQSSITTLGTVTTGIWNGTAIGDSYISSAATWNAKQDPISLTTTGISGAATLLGNTLNIPQYSEGVCFSPMSLAACDTSPTAATTQYYYQTMSEVTGSVNRVKLWGYTGSDTVLFAIYRGTLKNGVTLIGQGSAVCSSGPNEITLTPEVGQTLDLTVGEDLVVGFYPSGTSWRTVYDTGISDIYYGLINSANITTMPATPTGTATAVRFACALYEV